MESFERAMSDGTLRFLDGGLSTQLELAGADLDHPLWTGQTLLADPAAIRDAHIAFIDAGADVVISASYQVSFEGFRSLGLDAAATERALRASVAVAREAGSMSGRDVFVAASVGPYGAILADGSEFRGDYGLRHGELVAFHQRRLSILHDARPDVMAIETIPSIVEARALVEVLQALSEAHAWFSFTCTDGRTLADGTPFAEAVSLVAEQDQVVAVGVNCTSPAHVTDLIRVMREVTDKPVVVYPNRGGLWDPAAKRWQGSLDDKLCRRAPEWSMTGASLIGGCCGTAASDIEALVACLSD
jgi:homocysteine S-methyltransferase